MTMSQNYNLAARRIKNDLTISEVIDKFSIYKYDYKELIIFSVPYSTDQTLP